jgi:hypothetical protein
LSDHAFDRTLRAPAPGHVSENGWVGGGSEVGEIGPPRDFVGEECPDFADR